MNTAVATAAKLVSVAGKRIDPRRDPEEWVRNNERITNEADVQGWLALYAPDAVFEAITDGAYDRSEGIEKITATVRNVSKVCGQHKLHIKKRFVSASGNTIVNAWSGGFNGRDRQFGVEIWTLREDKVVRHEQYTFMDVRSSRSTVAKLRALVTGELGVKLAIASGRAQVARGSKRSG